MQLANRAIYLCGNRDPVNQGHVFFYVFHFEWISFSDDQLSKVSARPTVFNSEIYEGRIEALAHEKVARVRISASGTGLKKLYYTCLLNKND